MKKSILILFALSLFACDPEPGENPEAKTDSDWFSRVIGNRVEEYRSQFDCEPFENGQLDIYNELRQRVHQEPIQQD